VRLSIRDGDEKKSPAESGGAFTNQ
jgi:hypothetical protein